MFSIHARREMPKHRKIEDMQNENSFTKLGPVH